MRNLSSRLVSFGEASIHLEYTDGAAGRIAEFLFNGVPGDESIDPHVNIRVREDKDGCFSLLVAGEATCSEVTPAVVARELLEAVCFHLAAKSASGLVLHAASLMCEGCGLMLPGRSGAGKTTVSAFLSRKGFRYLSDELTYVAEGSLTIAALKRPLKIKTGGLAALERHLELDPPMSRSLAGPDDVLLAADSSYDDPPAPAPLEVIVFPRFSAGGFFSIEPLSPARSALRLMECLLNARNLSDHGFAEVTRLARSVPAYEMRYAELEQLDPNLHVLRRLAAGVETETARPYAS